MSELLELKEENESLISQVSKLKNEYNEKEEQQKAYVVLKQELENQVQKMTSVAQSNQSDLEAKD